MPGPASQPPPPYGQRPNTTPPPYPQQPYPQRPPMQGPPMQGPPPQQRAERPPRGAWVQVVLAVVVVLPLATALVGVLGWQAFMASDRASTYADVNGETDVLVAELDFVEISPLVPVATGIYDVAVPADAPVPEAGGTAQLKIDNRWGLPPSEDHAQQLQVLVHYGEWSTSDGLYVRHVFALDTAPIGQTLEPVTDESVRAVEQEALLRWGAVALTVLLTIGLLVLLTVRGRRRARLRREWVQRTNGGRVGQVPVAGGRG